MAVFGNRKLDDGWSNVHEFAAAGDIGAIKQLDSNAVAKLTSKQETALHIAAQFGQADIISYLSDNYPTMLDLCCIGVNNVLHIAVQYKQTAVVERLGGKYHMTSNSNGETPIQEAVAIGFIEGVVIMLHHRPEVLTWIDNSNRTLVHIAVESRQINVLHVLLAVCPKSLLLVQDNTGNTALNFAVSRGAFEMVKLIYNANPTSINIPDSNDMTPFLKAATFEFVSIVQYLIEKNPCLVESTTTDGLNVLHLMSNIKTAKKAITIKPDLIYALTKKNENVLHMATFEDYVLFLLEIEPSLLDGKNDKGKTPFQVAVDDDDFEMIDAILTFKPDLIDADEKGNTVLHIAVRARRNELIALVFANRMSNLYCRNVDGQTPFHLAVSIGNTYALKLFRQHITVEMVVETHTLCVKHVDLQSWFLRQCETLSEHIPPELLSIIYAYLGLTLSKKRKTT